MHSNPTQDCLDYSTTDSKIGLTGSSTAGTPTGTGTATDNPGITGTTPASAWKYQSFQVL